MTQFQVTVDKEVLQGFFSGNEGLARLVEQVLNQVLAAQATLVIRHSGVRALRTEDPQPPCLDRPLTAEGVISIINRD